MKRVLTALLILSLVLLLSACLSNQPTGTETTGETTTGTIGTTKQKETTTQTAVTTKAAATTVVEIKDTKWLLTAWSASSVDPGDYSIALEFDKKSFFGYSTANSYSGDYITLPGGKINASVLYQTTFAGSPEAMQADSFYFGLLGSVEKYTISDDVLTLFDSNSNELLIFEKAL